MTEQKEIKELPVLRIKAHEREECAKKAVVSVKVAAAKYPMPKHIILHFRFKDGSEKVVVAHFVSMYKDYAFYFLRAAHAREVAPLVDQIQEVKAYEEEAQ
jgi:hypothetical protein